MPVRLFVSGITRKKEHKCKHLSHGGDPNKKNAPKKWEKVACSKQKQDQRTTQKEVNRMKDYFVWEQAKWMRVKEEEKKIHFNGNFYEETNTWELNGIKTPYTRMLLYCWRWFSGNAKKNTAKVSYKHRMLTVKCHTHTHQFPMVFANDCLKETETNRDRDRVLRFKMQKVAIAVSDQLTKIAIDGKYNTQAKKIWPKWNCAMIMTMMIKLGKFTLSTLALSSWRFPRLPFIRFGCHLVSVCLCRRIVQKSFFSLQLSHSPISYFKN